jgi:hypothetical protein
VHARRHSQPPQHGFLIWLVGDAETGLQSDVLAELPQQLGAECVDGPAPDPIHPIPVLARQTLGDLAGSLVGESEDADSLGRDSKLIDEKPNALDQTVRLPRSGSGKYEQRSERPLDRRALRVRGYPLNEYGVGGDRRRIESERSIRERGAGRAVGSQRQSAVVR